MPEYGITSVTDTLGLYFKDEIPCQNKQNTEILNKQLFCIGDLT